jgi:acyl carrier protein
LVGHRRQNRIYYNYTYSDKNIDYSTKIIDMDIQEIKNRVKKVTAKVLEIDESEITDNANFSFDLGASSMQSILLVAGFQEEFNIEMDEEKSLEIQTISEAADFISTCIKRI